MWNSTFSTDVTDMWILASVDVGVELHALLADKAQAAVFTLVGAFPSV